MVKVLGWHNPLKTLLLLLLMILGGNTMVLCYSENQKKKERKREEKKRKKEIVLLPYIKEESATKTCKNVQIRGITMVHVQKCPLIMQIVWLGMQIGKSNFIGRIISAKHLKTKHRGACQCLSPYAQSLWFIYPTAQKNHVNMGRVSSQS